MIFTWVVDFIWIVYWGATWSSSEYQKGGASGSSTFVMVLSIINFIFKVKFGIIVVGNHSDIVLDGCRV